MKKRTPRRGTPRCFEIAVFFMTHVFIVFPVKREGMSLTNVLAGRPHVPDGLPFPFLHVRRSSAHSACQVSTDGRLLFSPDARMGRIGSTFREEVCSYWSNNLSPRKGLENYFHLTLEKSDVMSKSFVTRAESRSRPFVKYCFVSSGEMEFLPP